ncbi:roadblock/LC7 domain-containing protein [Streptosporangiaceae bacterium NEAU-GS5]|nr:roadblock/LC7 domain-containing protein [Streptosporangiaceae bacterium NEAU-GS5]
MTGIIECLVDAMSIPGTVSAILIDPTGATPVAAEGALNAEQSAIGLSEAFRAAMEGVAQASAGDPIRIEDMIIKSSAGMHIIHPLETMFGGPYLLCLRLDADRANLALAWRRLQSLSNRLIDV